MQQWPYLSELTHASVYKSMIAEFVWGIYRHILLKAVRIPRTIFNDNNPSICDTLVVSLRLCHQILSAWNRHLLFFGGLFGAVGTRISPIGSVIGSTTAAVSSFSSFNLESFHSGFLQYHPIPSSPQSIHHHHHYLLSLDTFTTPAVVVVWNDPLTTTMCSPHC